MAQNGPKWPKMAVFELSQPPQGRFDPYFVLGHANKPLWVRGRVHMALRQYRSQMTPKCNVKWPIMAQNGPEWPKMAVFELSQPPLGRFDPHFVLGHANKPLWVRGGVHRALRQ